MEGRLASEPAFRKNCEGFEVTDRISNGMAVDGELWLGRNFVWERFLGRGTFPQNFAWFARAVWEILLNQGRLVGASCTFRGHFALSKGTSLGHKEIGSCVFSKTLYGSNWGGMRIQHRISGQSEVVWRVNPRFEKIAKVWRFPT